MGKRKMHSKTYYICDYTGFPMLKPCCYLPCFDNAKMTKKGNYCNWETVVSEAWDMWKAATMTTETLTKILDHIVLVSGMKIDLRDDGSGVVALFLGEDGITPFSWCELDHMCAGGFTAEQLAAFCDHVHSKFVRAVRVLFDGDFELVELPVTEFELACYTEVAAVKAGPYSEYVAFELLADAATVPHNLPAGSRNETASALFKTPLGADVYVVCRSTEESFRKRNRYLPITVDSLKEKVAPKKRQKRQRVVPAGLSGKEYAQLKDVMEKNLDDFELKIKKDVATPAQQQQGASMPPATAEELMTVCELKGMMPPERVLALEERLRSPRSEI